MAVTAQPAPTTAHVRHACAAAYTRARVRGQAAWWRANRWWRARIRRETPPSMVAEWMTDDCWTWAFGDAPRPAVLCAPNEQQAFAQAVECYGSIPALITGIALDMPDWKLIPRDSDRMPSDVVLGATVESGFVIAKVDQSYLPIERRRAGYAVAQFVRVYAVYRREAH